MTIIEALRLSKEPKITNGRWGVADPSSKEVP